jgi:hypothetical protein
MSETSKTGEAILEEMVEGLKGVAPGPWECDWTDSENDEGTFQSHLLWDKDSNVIADAINATATDIIMEHSGDFDEYVDVIDVLAMNNFRHFARCSPDNIRAIATYASVLKAERDAALERARYLDSQVHVPGKLACPKCDFVLISMTLHLMNGAVTANNEPDVCPNGCGPLWKVSERSEREFWSGHAEKQSDEILKLKAALSSDLKGKSDV